MRDQDMPPIPGSRTTKNTYVAIDEDKLRDVFRRVEETNGGPFKFSTPRYVAAAALYNKLYPECGGPEKVTYTVVRLRDRDFGVPVERNKLQAIIKEIEKNGPLANRSQLVKKVGLLYNQRHAEVEGKVTDKVVWLRFNTWTGMIITSPMKSAKETPDGEGDDSGSPASSGGTG
jgi:hypothetical protein